MTTNKTTPVTPQPDANPTNVIAFNKGKSDLIDKANKGLGYLVCWDMKGLRKSAEEIKVAARTAGLDVSLVDGIEPVHPRTAALRAKDKFNRKFRNLDVPFKIEIKSSRGSNVEVEILRRDNENVKKPYTLVDSITINNEKHDQDYGKAIGGIIDQATLFIQYYNYERAYLIGNDVYTSLIKPITEGCRRIPVARGLYFISNQHSDTVLKLQDFNKVIGTSFDLMSLMSDAKTKETVAAKAKNEIESNIAKVKEVLAGWEDRKNVRGSSQDKLLQELTDMITMADEVRETLELETEELIKHIEETRKAAIDIIDAQNYTYTKEQLAQWQAYLVADNALEVTSTGLHFLASYEMIPGYEQSDVDCIRKLGYFTYDRSSDGLIVISPVNSI